MLKIATFCLFAIIGISLLKSVVLADGGYGPETVVQHSGYIDVNQASNNGAHIFYWMFESRVEPASAPLVLWMTGGPGCSSELAIFYEQGPYRLADNGNITLNPHAWNEIANVIYVDQPVGTGFSYADSADDYVTNESQVGEDMLEFMHHFYEKFPQFKLQDFYVTGESYAGHYVPAVCSAIFLDNKKNARFHIPLKGFAIGNGMVNAKLQIPEYLTYAIEKKLISNEFIETTVKDEIVVCEKSIGFSTTLATITCQAVIATIFVSSKNFNIYDVREPCKHPPLCYDFSPLDTLMSSASVQESLGVNPKAKWTECNGQVHQKLQADWFTSCDTYLPAMLEAGINALIYSGKEDFICNYRGGIAWSEKLSWSGQTAYNNKSFRDWKIGKSEILAGSIKKQRNFTFLTIYNAGHMVPMNQPEVALEMLRELISGNSFAERSPQIAFE